LKASQEKDKAKAAKKDQPKQKKEIKKDVSFLNSEMETQDTNELIEEVKPVGGPTTTAPYSSAHDTPE